MIVRYTKTPTFISNLKFGIMKACLLSVIIFFSISITGFTQKVNIEDAQRVAINF